MLEQRLAAQVVQPVPASPSSSPECPKWLLAIPSLLRRLAFPRARTMSTKSRTTMRTIPAAMRFGVVSNDSSVNGPSSLTPSVVAPLPSRGFNLTDSTVDFATVSS